MTEQKKDVRPVSTPDIAGQLSSSITNVATLPKGSKKVTDSLQPKK